MLAIHDYALFVTTAVLLNLTPGPDTLFIVGRSIASGRRAGVASALGISTGCLFHTFAAAFGLSAVLAASATAFAAVKYLGAAYLVFVGVKMLFAHGAAPAAESVSVTAAPKLWAIFRQGALTNILNPKVALFFLALLPQFVDAHAEHPVPAFLALGFTFVTTGTIYGFGVALSAARLTALFRRSASASRWANRMTGSIFIALGLKLATVERA